MKQEVTEILEYLWSEERNHYALCLLEEGGMELNDWFEGLDLNKIKDLKKVLNKNYCSSHIFMTLVKLKIELCQQ